MRTIGLRSFIRFNLVLAGTPIIAVLNLVFWLITVVWFLGQPAVVGAVFPWYIYFPALVALILGNFATLYMNLIALREDDRSDLLVPGAHGAGVLVDDERCRRQGHLSVDPQSVVLGEDVPRISARPDVEARGPDVTPGCPAPAAGEARRTSWPLSVYLAVGYWLQVGNGFILGDALSRVSAAQSALFSRDPHLAAIGFIFTPLTAMVQIPAVCLEPAVAGQ